MVRVATDRHVRWLHFDRPDKLNAFTVEAYRDLCDELHAVVDDSDVHVVVLTGEGRAFSAGADRSLLGGSDGADTTDTELDAGEEFERLVMTLATYPKPLVAAVNGFAVGVGCTMLLHCDFVVAARSARLRLPFTSMGIVPEAASSVLLPTRVRWDEAMWAVLSSEWIEAERAQQIGLVWRVVDDNALADEATAVATTLADLDPDAVAATKALLVAGREDAVRAAHQRELAAMGALMDPARSR